MPEGYAGRFAAQIAALGAEGQERLRKARVHVAGFGGLGNLTAFLVTASGVGHVSANDPQALEADNLGRFVCTQGSSDLGLPKVQAAARFFASRPDFSFMPLVAATESGLVDNLFEQADWIICASNTVSSRLACARKALRYGKPLLDVAVADGRHRLAGAVKYKLPDCHWAACPACYLDPELDVERGEALLLPVLSLTAALAAHMLVRFLSGRAGAELKQLNCFLLQAEPPFALDALTVERRATCAVCGHEPGRDGRS